MEKFGYEDDPTNPKALEQFKDNFAQIGVYFESFSTKFITEEPKYTVTQM